jgi:hypothetical protein
MAIVLCDNLGPVAEARSPARGPVSVAASGCERPPVHRDRSTLGGLLRALRDRSNRRSLARGRSRPASSRCTELANLRTVTHAAESPTVGVTRAASAIPIGAASVGDAPGLAGYPNEKDAAVQTEMLPSRDGGTRVSIRETMPLASWRQRGSGRPRAADRVVEHRHASFVNRRDRLELDRLTP